MNKNMFLKGILLLASSALLLGGCSEDKTIPGDNDGQAIVFRVQNALPSSRAAGTTVGYMDAFVINGVVDKVESGHKSGLTLFDRTTVSRVIGSGANVFTYSPTKYYPKGAAKAEFSAFSPVSSRIAASDFQTSDPPSPSDNRITYTVPSPARGRLTGDVDVAPQEDLLVAYTRKDDLSGAVVLQFRHALSRVSVKAVNLIDQPVRIHSLSLHNLYTQGTLDIDGDDWGITDKADINEEYIKPVDVDGRRHTDYKTLWDTNGQTKKALAWQLAESGVMVPVGGSPMQVTADDQALLVLPQTTQNTGNDAKADPGDFYLEVTYTVGKITETIPATFNDINKLAPANGKGLTFEMGRQYAINVSITATGLSFGLEVNDWDEKTPTYAATTVVFNGNKPAEASDWDAVENIPLANSSFFYGQDLLELTTAPVLDGWIFQGYYDSPEPGAKRYYSSTLERQIVFDSNGDGTLDATKWDKAGPSCTLYAHWAEATNVWGASNIYFRPDASSADGSVGSLTFVKSDQTKSGYQGLYFKWGSLIGIAAGIANEDFTDDTYLYIPDLSSGKYYKVQAGAVSATYSSGTDDMNFAVQAYAKGVAGQGKNWADIPYATDAFTSAQKYRSQSPLTDNHSTLVSGYKGDICKFLSDNKTVSGLTRKWVLPTSDKWKGEEVYRAYVYTPDGARYNKKNGSWTGTAGNFFPSDADGTGSHAIALMTYTITSTGEEVTFPASGVRRSDMLLYAIGYDGYYWSSSVANATAAYNLGFNYKDVHSARPDPRAWERSVRCYVQN